LIEVDVKGVRESISLYSIMPDEKPTFAQDMFRREGADARVRADTVKVDTSFPSSAHLISDGMLLNYSHTHPLAWPTDVQVRPSKAVGFWEFTADPALHFQPSGNRVIKRLCREFIRCT
jgi:hypothetical protein